MPTPIANSPDPINGDYGGTTSAYIPLSLVDDGCYDQNKSSKAKYLELGKKTAGPETKTPSITDAVHLKSIYS